MQISRRAVVETAAGGFLLASTATVVMSCGAPIALADPTVPIPSPQELTADLNTIFDTSASGPERAAHLEGGTKGIRSADDVANALHGSPIALQVQNPRLNGDHLDAQLAVTAAGMGIRSYPLTWLYQDTQWKLSNQSFCAIATQISRSCSV